MSLLVGWTKEDYCMRFVHPSSLYDGRISKIEISWCKDEYQIIDTIIEYFLFTIVISIIMHRIQRKLEGEMPIYFELIINQNIISPSLVVRRKKVFTWVIKFLSIYYQLQCSQKKRPFRKIMANFVN